MIGRGRDLWCQRPAGLLTIYRVASDIAAKGAMFIVTIAAARTLERDDFGRFALASTLGWLVAIAADLGIQAHLARSVAQRSTEAASALRRWLPVRAATGLAGLSLALVSLRLMDSGRGEWLSMSLLVTAYAASGFSECVYHFFRGLGRSDLESTLTLVQRGAMGALALGALWWHPSLNALALAMLVPAAATAGIALVVANRLAPEWQGPGSSRNAVWHELVGDVAPIGVGILLSALYFRVDVFLLERWSDTSQVALYNAVFRVIDALRLFPAAALAVALPSLCRAHDARPLMRIALPLTSGAVSVAGLLWLTAAPVVTTLYGTQFASAVLPFRTLLLSVPLMTLNYALTQQLIGWHGQRAFAILCACALVINLSLNAATIPGGGMQAAAWSTVWTEAFLTAGSAVALLRTMPARGLALAAAGPPQIEEPL